MQILKRGTEYLLGGSDRVGAEKPLYLKFCHKNAEGAFVNGMTSEEVMEMMIDRQQFLIEKDSSAENIQALLNLRKALDCMKARNSNKMHKKKISDSARNGISLQAKSATG